MEIDFVGNSQNSIIKVIGVGGGGTNAVNAMFKAGIQGVDFLVCNTDVQSLNNSVVLNKIHLGKNQTKGLGGGADPLVGRQSAEESIDEIKEYLKNNTQMVFITAGMGGATGTGASPVIASVAKQMGILTVGIVTTPFHMESKWRMEIAMSGINNLREHVDTLIVINNQNLIKLLPKNIKMKDAYSKVDEVLLNAAKGISEIITKSGYINVDFADVRTIMKDGGSAIMGTACFEGENRALLAVEEALSSPLLDNVDISGADGVLLNITASEETLTMEEVSIIGEYVNHAVGENARIIFGQVYDESMGDKLSVTVIATGFDKKKSKKNTIPSLSLNDFNHQNTSNEILFVPDEPIENTQHFNISKLFHKEPASTPKSEEKPLVYNELNEESHNQTETTKIKLEEKDNITIEPKINAQPVYKTEFSEKDLLEEKKQKVINDAQLDYKNTERMKQLENQPAWVRRNIHLEDISTNPKLSKFSIDVDENGKGKLRENNSFLFDAVD
jgi:cell division protein FtsZ